MSVEQCEGIKYLTSIPFSLDGTEQSIGIQFSGEGVVGKVRDEGKPVRSG
jgi:hypothetical protein